MKSRIQNLLKTLNEGVWEKESEIGLSLLAALAGQSILLLGPPGVAKSMVARRLKEAFTDARSFEYLMSRFSTPDEIFGPVSISRLKESDRYVRAVDGYLPTADVVFLDEIWKAGPAIQNTLLTVINEKIYLNGDQPMKLPLKLLIAASNELPQEGEGLEALWDRFIIRVVSGCIEDEKNFRAMMRSGEGRQVEDSQLSLEVSVASADAITSEEYALWQRQISAITIPDEVLEAISMIRQELKSVAVDGQEACRQIYVSDRRWKNIARLLRASAFVHDRQEVSLSDLQLAVHCLWNEPDEIAAIGRIVSRALFCDSRKRLESLHLAIGMGLRKRAVREAMERARQHGDHRDDDLILFDHFYYGIDPRAGENIFIYATDFRSLPTRSADEPAVKGVMYKDSRVPRRTIIRAYSNPDNLGEHDVEMDRVNLYRDSSNLYVNGVRYPLRRALRGASLEQESGLEPASMRQLLDLSRDYESEVDNLFVSASTLFAQMRGHLFVSKDVLAMISSQMETFRKQIAVMRADVRKLIYDE